MCLISDFDEFEIDLVYFNCWLEALAWAFAIPLIEAMSFFRDWLMLSKEFTKWVLIANIVAWPLAGYLMHSWLDNFEYKISINWWIYFLAGSLALIIAILTVGVQSVKAALANPVESLRYE